MDLSKKKLEVELLRVQSARADLELRVLEREEEIERIKQNIELQVKKELELKEKLGI
jgi:hypothetical protein